jgi:hypothetical protein
MAILIASSHNPQFNGVSDIDLSNSYILKENHREELMAKIDNCQNEHEIELLYAEIDNIEHQIFLIDDELCARGLPLPNA